MERGLVQGRPAGEPERRVFVGEEVHRILIAGGGAEDGGRRWPAGRAGVGGTRSGSAVGVVVFAEGGGFD